MVPHPAHPARSHGRPSPDLRIGLGIYCRTPSGLAVAPIDTALALTDAGAEVVLFTDPDLELPERAQPLEDRVVRVEGVPSALREGPGAAALFLPAKLALSGALARALETHPVDVMHTFSPGFAARLPRSVPVAVQAWFHPPRLGPRLRTLMPFVRLPVLYPPALAVQLQSHASDLLGYRRSDLTLANTPSAEMGLRERGLAARCIPPAVNVADQAPRREPSEVFRVAFCSHPLNGRRKGLIYLLQALRLVRHRPLEVTLVGGAGPDFDEEIAAARGDGVDVRVLGLVPREEYLEQLASRTDLLAFTSLYEEWGYALFEALSQGVPALVFDLYPFSELIDDDTGIVVPPRDVPALAGAIDRAAAGGVADPETVIESTRTRFGAERVAASLLDAYAAMVSPRAAA